MPKVTEQAFEDYILNLDDDDFLETITDLGFDRWKILTFLASPNRVESERQQFRESECYMCDDCREYFTDSDDLDEDDLCSGCRDDEETQLEKAQQEHSEGVIDG